jgi:hypothetical protein
MSESKPLFQVFFTPMYGINGFFKQPSCHHHNCQFNNSNYCFVSANLRLHVKEKVKVQAARHHHGNCGCFAFFNGALPNDSIPCICSNSRIYRSLSSANGLSGHIYSRDSWNNKHIAGCLDSCFLAISQKHSRMYQKKKIYAKNPSSLDCLFSFWNNPIRAFHWTFV